MTRAHPRAFALTLGAIFMALLAGAGCAKRVNLGVTLVTQGCVGADGGTAVVDPTAGVVTLRFLVTVAGVTQSPVDVPLGQSAATLPLVPFDETTRVDVFGLGPSTTGVTDAPLAFGTTADFVIPSSTTADTVDETVVLRKTDAFSGQPIIGGTTCAQLTLPRAYHSQTVLSDGRVLIYGGLQFPPTVDWSLWLGMPPQPVAGTSYLDSAEIFDPTTGQFTSAGSFVDPAGVVPGKRTQPMLVTSVAADGGASLLGGGTILGDGGIAGAPNGADFGPPANWDARRFLAAHDLGCAAADTAGHVMAAAGLDQNGVASAAGETLDPTVWPTGDTASVPVGDAGTEARVTQACSGLLGKLGGTTQSLVIEVGGFTTDAHGQNVSLLGDLFFYDYTSSAGTFEPLLVHGSFATASLTAGARTRARAAALSVVDPVTGKASDAVLITGGMTCDTGTSAGCTPTFADGGTAGQLGGLLSNYFSPLMAPTEMLAFPTVIENGGQQVANITVIAGPVIPSARIDHCEVSLPNGNVLMLGGLGFNAASQFGTLTDARYTLPAAAVPLDGGIAVPSWNAVANPLQTPRAGMACSVLKDGSVLVTGGYQTTGPLTGTSQPVQTLSSVEIYTPIPTSITAPAGS